MHKSSTYVIHNRGDETLPWHNIPIHITILFAVVVIVVVVCLYYGKANGKISEGKCCLVTEKEKNDFTVHKDMSNFCYYTEAY